jgi:hypothetical protein
MLVSKYFKFQPLLEMLGKRFGGKRGHADIRTCGQNFEKILKFQRKFRFFRVFGDLSFGAINW